MCEVITFPIKNKQTELPADDNDPSHPYPTMLTRHCRTRVEAFTYLASRGFLFLPSGWKNGRWVATIEPTPHDYSIAIRLPLTVA